MNGVCRLCASFKKPEFLTAIKDQSPDNIRQKMSVCLNVNVRPNDSLPKSVCQECMKNLNVSYTFYTKVQDAQETLLTFFPNAAAQATESVDVKREFLEEISTATCEIIGSKDNSTSASTSVIDYGTDRFQITGSGAATTSSADDSTYDGYLREGGHFNESMDQDHGYPVDPPDEMHMPKVSIEHDSGQSFGVSAVSHANRMGKTRAESKRAASMRYLEKIRRDPLKYKEYCDKDAERKRRSREVLSKLTKTNSKLLKEKRENDRIRQKKLRDRKKNDAKEKDKFESYTKKAVKKEKKY